MAAADQFPHDRAHAWGAALSLMHYDAAAGPSEVSVGGVGEQHTLNRHEWLIDFYARDLLVYVDADLARLEALTADAKRRHADRVDRGAIERKIQAELVVIQLAATAATIVRDSGADTDPKARERLVAATGYQLKRDTSKAFLGDLSLASGPDGLIEELDRIDRD